MNKEIIVFGLRDYAELVHFYFTNDSDYTIVAFSVDNKYKDKEEFLGLPVVDFETVEKEYPPSKFDFFVALGYSESNQLRSRKYFEAKNKGYNLVSYVSSKNSVWPNFEVGENTFIMENNTIMPFAKIGSNILIFAGNVITHHIVIDDHVTISCHCAIGGNVHIKSRVFIGLNSTLRNGIIVEEGTIIAAGSNVIKDTEKNEVYMGNPAKKTGKKSYEINI